MKSQTIEQIKKRFHREWLLIAIDRMREETTMPEKGHLLAHSSNRDEIHQKMLRRKGLTLVTYSDNRLPTGYAVAL